MAIMKKELVLAVTGKSFAKLLQCPVNSRMLRNVEVNETSGSDLKGDEHIKDTEVCRYRNEEITSDYTMSMIPEEACPPLVL
jgi:hypothetical protein